MAKTQSLEAVLKEYFVPTDKKSAKGEAKYVIVVNGTTTTRIKGKKDLEKTLRSMALEDARKGTETKVLIYKLEGTATVDFSAEVNVTNDSPKDGEAE